MLKELSIVGSVVGNRLDAEGTLHMAARGVVMTPYAVKPLSKLNEVFEMMIKKLKGRMIRDLTKVQFHNSSESLHLSQSICSE